MTSRLSHKILTLAAAAFLFGACQGQISEKPPVHPQMNMDQQDRKEAQEENTFFADGRSMRQPVEGTIARGYKKDDLAYYEGVDSRGNWIEEMPVDVTKDLLYRGKERYEIFCTPCHGTIGDGQGIIMVGKYGYVPAPSYHDQRLVDAPDGELYSAIYNGVRSMPSYATQIPADDRWAIVAYIRALQKSQNVDEDQMREYGVDLAALNADYSAEQRRLAELAEARKPKETPEPTADLGKNLITQNACGACHNETGDPGGIGPTWKNVFGSTGEVITDAGETITVTKDADYIIESIVNPGAKKSVEYAQGVMAPYALADFELEAIVEYIKTLSDN